MSAPALNPPSMIGRAVAILGAFDAERGTLGISQLARLTGLPKSTVHRLAAELIREGLLEAVDGGFRLGVRLFELGHLVPRQRGLRELAVPLMSELREVSRQTVHLAVLDGTDVLYVEILPGRTGPRLPSRVGGRMPAHATAVGKALLAHARRPALDEVLAAGLPRRTPRTIVAPGLLHTDLRRIAQRGIALDIEESATGLMCVASPVLDAAGLAVAALSISGRTGQMPVGRLGPAVRTAAATLGRQLAGPHG